MYLSPKIIPKAYAKLSQISLYIDQLADYRATHKIDAMEKET